jgi:glycosyltransferase involved in cell wall biosynthesis
MGADTVGLGWLEDPGDEIASWSAMIVPIRFGSGTRVKIAEGFARKCPVVATKIGAFGYAVKNGKEFLLADTAADFASACVLLLKQPEFGEALAETAHNSLLSRWTWESFEGSVRSVVQGALNTGTS